MVTPIASAYELDYQVCGREGGDETRQTLLLRLFGDLNDEKLDRNEIMWLTEYCVEMIQKRDYQKAVDEDLEARDLSDYQMSGLADNHVKFMLESLLDNIKSNEMSHEDVTKLTMTVIESSKGIDDESYLDK